MSGFVPTAKQAKILEFIERQISATGLPPTYRDIAEHCGYDAVGTVQDHVRALIRKGLLEKEPGRARGLRPSYRAQSSNVPILGTVPAGRPIEAIEDSRGSLSISPPPRSGAGEMSDLFALKVTGESMIEAGIMDGDYVIVRKQDHADDGDIVVAMIDGEATVKTLERRKGRARLLPANPKFSPIEVPEGAVIQGKVIGVQRFY